MVVPPLTPPFDDVECAIGAEAKADGTFEGEVRCEGFDVEEFTLGIELEGIDPISFPIEHKPSVVVVDGEFGGRGEGGVEAVDSSRHRGASTGSEV